MWEWSRTVTEYAAAAAWTSTRSEETEPKYGDAEYRAETEGDETAEGDGVGMAARDPIGGYDLVG
ncbi:hypothetical protein OH799_29700 [Nocardia sp. NBC_00881]|uniref:hypothetical protein n=1 Tax=Nocardia sp. NBC_00881 TaxID=2975995 RepID=UPI00386A7680|nr:hypothetical protein OH799_29700 [Nocardia sp. NBC_00881]